MSTKKCDHEDDEDDEIYFNRFDNNITLKDIHFYISSQIEQPKHYVDLIHTIRTSPLNSKVTLHLNTPGGSVDTTVQIINAIRSSKGTIITSLEGEVCSAGSVIFLSGDELLIHDDSLLMVHNYRSSTYGKGHEQKAQLDGVDKWVSKLMRNIYIPFLTERELKRVFDGEDFWFTSDQVRTRVERMIKKDKRKK